MARAAICAVCGAKVRAGRGRCPRCRALLTAPDPALAAASGRRLRHASAVLVAAFAIVVVVLWFVRDPTPSPQVAGMVISDPFAARRQALPTAGAATASAAPKEGEVRPFLDPAGAASTAYAAGDYATSLAQYMAAVDRNPQDAESLSNLGQVLVRLNRPSEAIPYFERAMAILPGRWAYQFNLARALGLVGRMDESIASYRRAQQLFPDDYATTFNLALALHKKGDEVGAVEQYLRAIELQPDDASFRKALGVSYERLAKVREAAAAYHEYLRLSPSAPDADKVRARIAQLEAPAGPVAEPPVAPGGPAGR